MRLNEIIKASNSQAITACHFLEGSYGSGFFEQNVLVLPVYGLSDRSLVILGKDLHAITTLDILNRTSGKMCAREFKHKIISEPEIPPDTVKGKPCPCSKIILRPGRNKKENKNYKNIMDSLTSDMELFMHPKNT